MSYDLLSDWYGNDGHITQFLRIMGGTVGNSRIGVPEANHTAQQGWTPYRMVTYSPYTAFL